MPNFSQVYSLGICTGVGLTLTLLALATRLGIVAPDALPDVGCLVAGTCLLLVGHAWWLRYKSSDERRDLNR
ncbi:hypothetical protein SAMN06265222_12920 [Neorhodopirellula lusitana]|uniref:Uncharacterized protein n=1 Tax=Neorhodopirellula lusitana TaxID=445327 RepID=A0ABY1QSM1_9BACT|nr:hypothetical protein SAMN06265222_12920 [Neorhodopirellula lusitana]